MGEAVLLEVGLVRDGGGDAVDGGGGDEVAPVVVVIQAVLGVEGGGEAVCVGEVEGIGVGEEVCEGLVLHGVEQRLAGGVEGRRAACEEVVAAEGVWGCGQRRGSMGWGLGEGVQPNGGGSLSLMAGGGRPMAGAPAGLASAVKASAASLRAWVGGTAGGGGSGGRSRGHCRGSRQSLGAWSGRAGGRGAGAGELGGRARAVAARTWRGCLVLCSPHGVAPWPWWETSSQVFTCQTLPAGQASRLVPNGRLGLPCTGRRPSKIRGRPVCCLHLPASPALASHHTQPGKARAPAARAAVTCASLTASSALCVLTVHNRKHVLPRWPCYSAHGLPPLRTGVSYVGMYPKPRYPRPKWQHLRVTTVHPTTLKVQLTNAKALIMTYWLD